ncbi:MAG: hypothetical protein RUMPE_00544 [Eubacteriales bacterium SKADARSKE-1]|nr:hypothetical protein [Eubacteriales bacterium SKADARSKE-1]
MGKDYIVSIIGTQITGEQAEEVQLLVPCSYRKTENTVYLNYSEFDKNNDNSEIKSTLEIDENNMVTLIRDGTQKSKLTLEKGKRHLCSYNTDFGTIMIGAFAKEINYDLNENGGFIELLYSLDVNTEFLSTNLVLIRIKKGENKNVSNCK